MALINCILYKKSTQQIINNNTVLDSDSLPVHGLDEDLEYYAKYIPDDIPGYDQRGYNLITTGLLSENNHPDYGLKAYEITYSIERKSDAELQQSVDNEQENADSQLRQSYNYTKSEETRVQRIQNRRQNGDIIEGWEDALLDKVDNMADKMNQNADNADSMYDFIEANPTLVPDFDTGWITG